MSRPRRRRETFAELVAEVRDAPVPPPAPPQPGWYDDEIVDRERVVWTLVTRPVSAAVAHQLVQDGARVVWDPCGCGGYCTPTWVGASGLESMRARRPATPRDRHASFASSASAQ